MAFIYFPLLFIFHNLNSNIYFSLLSTLTFSKISFNYIFNPQSFSNPYFLGAHNSPPLLCGKLHVQQLTSESNSCLRTNHFRRKMTSDNRYFLNTLPLFNASRLDIWKYRFRMFLQIINYELSETIVNGMFIPTHQVKWRSR